MKILSTLFLLHSFAIHAQKIYKLNYSKSSEIGTNKTLSIVFSNTWSISNYSSNPELRILLDESEQPFFTVSYCNENHIISIPLTTISNQKNYPSLTILGEEQINEYTCQHLLLVSETKTVEVWLNDKQSHCEPANKVITQALRLIPAEFTQSLLANKIAGQIIKIKSSGGSDKAHSSLEFIDAEEISFEQLSSCDKLLLRSLPSGFVNLE